MFNVLRDPRLGLVWLAARLWVGWEFLYAGWEKTFGADSAAWWGSNAGVRGFLSFAASPQMTGGQRPPVASWYGSLIDNLFLPIDGFFAVAIPLGELLVGVGLIAGLLTSASAFFGALMSLNFMLAGALATGKNPLMFALELLILFAGTAAYVYGADRVAIPRLKAAWAARGGRTRHRPVPLAH